VKFDDGSTRTWILIQLNDRQYNIDCPDWAWLFVNDVVSLCDCCQLTFPMAALASTCFRFEEMNMLMNQNQYSTPVVFDTFCVGNETIGTHHVHHPSFGHVRLDIIDVRDEYMNINSVCIMRDDHKQLADIAQTACHEKFSHRISGDRYVILVRMPWTCYTQIFTSVAGRRHSVTASFDKGDYSQLAVYTPLHPDARGLKALTMGDPHCVLWNRDRRETVRLENGIGWNDCVLNTLEEHPEWTESSLRIMTLYGNYSTMVFDCYDPRIYPDEDNIMHSKERYFVVDTTEDGEFIEGMEPKTVLAHSRTIVQDLTTGVREFGDDMNATLIPTHEFSCRRYRYMHGELCVQSQSSDRVTYMTQMVQSL